MKNQLLKTYLLLLFILTSLASFGQNINFPDPVFKQALLDHLPIIDTDGDGEITILEASLITALEISGYEKEYQYVPNTGTQILVEGIYDFTGIENFTNLTSLICDDNDLTSLDVSALTNLEYLDCSGQINRNITLSTSPFPGGLTSLILPNTSTLTYLDCSRSYLTSLDVSPYTALTTLNASTNGISNLILPTSNSLIELSVYSNQLITLDASNFTSLSKIDCLGNNLTSLVLPNTTTLTRISCSHNELTNLNVIPYTGLEYLSFSNNFLTNIDLTQNLLLEFLRLEGNQLTSLDVSANTELEDLLCFNNLITDLDLSVQTKLSYLKCNDNQLTSLNIKNGNNNLLRLDATNNPGLNLICVDNTN